MQTLPGGAEGLFAVPVQVASSSPPSAPGAKLIWASVRFAGAGTGKLTISRWDDCTLRLVAPPLSPGGEPRSPKAPVIVTPDGTGAPKRRHPVELMPSSVLALPALCVLAAP